jgi:hypothetical protein
LKKLLRAQNAKISVREPAFEFTYKDFQKVFNANVFNVFNTARAAAMYGPNFYALKEVLTNLGIGCGRGRTSPVQFSLSVPSTLKPSTLPKGNYSLRSVIDKFSSGFF